MQDLNKVIDAISHLQYVSHKVAIDHGFNSGNQDEAKTICLIHAELSEALEGLRHGNPPSDHIPEYSAVEEELADVIIRVMDYAEGKNYDIANAIVAKIQYNTNRPYKHGKAF